VRDDAPTFIDPAEDCPMRTPREILARQGYTPPAPHELSERQLPGRLWELLYAAAARRLFFDFSDHLSDRQFYALLWEQWIDEPVADIPLEAETNTTLLVAELNAIGMTHEEIWLRYYADDRDRALTGRSAEAERWLGLADGASSAIPLSDGSATIGPWVATLRAHMMRDGVEQALADAELALEQLPAGRPWVPTAQLARGVAHAQLALLEAGKGAWGQAGLRARAAQAVVDEAGLGDLSSSALAHVATARVAFHDGRLEDARAALTRTHRLRPLLDHPFHG
jgi:hypothetical protein